MSSDFELQEWLARLVSSPDFIRAHPGFVHVLARLKPVLDARVDVMGVSAAARGFRLHVNREYFRDKAEFLPGVLQHELHHLVLGHVTHWKFQYCEYPAIMQIAMETSANEYIQHPLPGEPTTWQRFAEYGLRAGQSTLERYALLVTARENGAPIPWQLELVDDHLDGGVGRWKARPARLLDRIRARQRRRGGPGNDTRNLLTELTDPAALRDPPDWRAGLAQFTHALRVPTASWQRPNRRFPDAVGVVPGRLRSADPTARPHLLVAIDTSGSMGRPILAAIGEELTRILRHARLTVVECDKVIQRVYPFTGRLGSAKGRGGTDLRPPFAAAVLRQQRPDGVVYFTDGAGPYPAECPIRTLWVLTGRAPFTCPWGTRLHLDVAS